MSKIVASYAALSATFIIKQLLPMEKGGDEFVGCGFLGSLARGGGGRWFGLVFLGGEFQSGLPLPVQSKEPSRMFRGYDATLSLGGRN